MAFHVTQCPGCESTFNTSARILQSAAGKVRCGACLTVFEAAANFLDSGESDDDDHSSVFVGNNPIDFFDPSLFITRSALTAPDPVNFADAEAVEMDAILPTPHLNDIFADSADAKIEEEEIEEEKIEEEEAQSNELKTKPVSAASEDAYASASQAFFDAVADELDFELSATPFEADSDSWLDAEQTPSNEVDDSATSDTAGTGMMPLFSDPSIAADSDEQETEIAAQSIPDSIPAPMPTAPAELTQMVPEDIRIHASFSLYRSPPPTSVATEVEPTLFEMAETPPSADAEQDSPAAALTADEQEQAIDFEVTEEPADTGQETLQFEDREEVEHVQQKIEESNETSPDNAMIDLDSFDYVTPANTNDPEPVAPEPESAVAAEIEDSTEVIRARALRAVLHDDTALEALPLESRTAIGRALPPVELLGGKEARWGKRLLLGSGCVLLAVTLSAQFLWQQLPVYSRIAQLRPLYEFACRFVTCELPVYSELSAIRSDNLVVRSHQIAEDALTVSLSFRNTARFPQPFPILILGFNSATNTVIALREFAPAEYLDKGLQAIDLMPVMSPVQVELDIMDPGQDAVNYTVAFRRQ